MLTRRELRGIDRPFLLTAIALMAIGLVALYSASFQKAQMLGTSFLFRQMIWIGVGGCLAVLLVLLSHASNVQIFLWPGLDFRGTGRAGVFLFFVLSAYLLTAQFPDCEPSALRVWRPR